MFVRQAAHVLDLLEFFAQTRQPATLTEISQKMAWPRSSTFNIISTLASKGFLYEPGKKGGHYPTPRWLALSRTITDGEPLPRNVITLISELVAETDETALIAAPAGTNAVFLHVEEPDAAIKYVASIGHLVPITATASGRAILSQYQPSELEQLLRRVKFEKLTPSTLISAEEVLTEIKQGAKRGWQINPGGNAPDLCGLALPFNLESRRLAIAIAGPIYRIEGREEALAQIMRKAMARNGLN